MNAWTTLKTKQEVDDLILNLKNENITAFYVENSDQAKKKVLELIPQKSRVLASSSQTLEKIGLSEEIDNSQDFISVRNEYMKFDHAKEGDKIRISRSTPDYIVGSIQAITKKGEAIIASNTGSQIAAYAGAAGKVIWVVSTNKIVKDVDQGLKRINEYVLPLESERLKKAYGVPSNVSKLMIVSKETDPSRITVIFVNEVLGY